MADTEACGDLNGSITPAVVDPVERIVREIGMNVLRIRGVCSEEELEAAREEFNSTMSALDEVFQAAVKTDPDHDEELTEIIREYINSMTVELYGQNS